MRNSLQSLIGALCLLAGVAHGQANPLLELLTDQAEAPAYLADPGDGRLFIVERAGRVRIFADGTLQAGSDAFLDIHNSVDQNGEGGMHSIAFDPSFATNRRVFVEYTRTGSGGPGLGLETVIASYTAMASDPNHVDPASVKQILTYQSPVGADFVYHKGGQLQFGPDDMLYFAFGDGGSANDPNCFAQTKGVLYGKMIRIDPNGSALSHPNYGIPVGNPFLAGNDPNDEYPDEIWALGFRNPYRFSFDRQTGDLWVGDVGQDTREEIDMDPNSPGGAGRGKNYGWKVFEGNLCHIANPGAAACPTYVVGCMDAQPMDPMYTPPLVDYDHTPGGGSIIGGYVYRGAATAWRGRYIFADFVRGEIYALTDDGGTPHRVVLFNADPFGLVSFGEDHNGELYVLDLGNNTVSRLRFDLLTQTKKQKSCVRKLNDGFRKIADEVSWGIRFCVGKDAAGKLGTQPTDDCVGADPSGKIGELSGKNSKIDTDLCIDQPPDVGYAGFLLGNDAAGHAELDLAKDVLGPVLDAAVISKASNKLGAACQKSVLSALAVCQKARRAEFLRCKNLGLKKNTLVSNEVLAACLDGDPKAKIAKACDPTTGKIATKAIASSCTAKGVDLALAFPGCAQADPAALAACLDTQGRCRTCELFDAADALETDCSTRGCPP